jgi:hypothetical protein
VIRAAHTARRSTFCCHNDVAPFRGPNHASLFQRPSHVAHIHHHRRSVTGILRGCVAARGCYKPLVELLHDFSATIVMCICNIGINFLLQLFLRFLHYMFTWILHHKKKCFATIVMGFCIKKSNWRTSPERKSTIAKNLLL